MSRELSVVSCQLPAGRPRLRRGFSFTEVMFAVIILGIGFIMVAGIFPVALQQAKLTTEETTGAALARSGAGFLVNAGDDSLATPNMPATGTATVPARSRVSGLGQAAGSVWNNVLGNMIQVDDPRFAWTALYRRDGDPAVAQKATWSPFAQVYVFAVTARNTERFDPVVDGKEITAGKPLLANLQPKPVRIAIMNEVLEAGGMDLIAIMKDGAASAPDYTGAAADGAYVIITDDEIQPPNANIGRMNGRIFRLGAERADMISYFQGYLPAAAISYVFELQPGNDFSFDSGADGILYDPTISATDIYGVDDVVAVGINGQVALPDPLSKSNVNVGTFAQAAVVGRSYTLPLVTNADDDPEFSGPSMAIGAYTTFVRVRK